MRRDWAPAYPLISAIPEPRRVLLMHSSCMTVSQLSHYMPLSPQSCSKLTPCLSLSAEQCNARSPICTGIIIFSLIPISTLFCYTSHTQILTLISSHAQVYVFLQDTRSNMTQATSPSSCISHSGKYGTLFGRRPLASSLCNCSSQVWRLMKVRCKIQMRVSVRPCTRRVV